MRKQRFFHTKEADTMGGQKKKTKKRKTRKNRKILRLKRILKKQKSKVIMMIILLLLIGIGIFFYSGGYQYNWEKYGKTDVTEEFLEKVLTISKELDTDPDDLMAVMAFESRLNHTTVNPLSGATGLIQWMPETAVELGTTTAELKNMTAIEQLDYVYKYLKPYTGKLKTISDLYMSVLWPAAVGEDEDYVLFEVGTTAYRQNGGLDLNEDGYITKAEATEKVIRNRDHYFDKAEELTDE